MDGSCFDCRCVAFERRAAAAEPLRGALRERLIEALNANAYRGSWSSDHPTMQPMSWREDDVVDRIIAAAALEATAPSTPECGDPEHPGGAFCSDTTGLSTCTFYGERPTAPSTPEPALDPVTLRESLRANLFDGDERGTVTMPISKLLDEIIEIAALTSEPRAAAPQERDEE